MQIAYTGLELPEGKVKYEDPVIIALTEKFAPRKVTPFYCTLVPDAYETSDIIIIARDKILDLLIHDMEKLETRRGRTEDAKEIALIEKVIPKLEKDMPACDIDIADTEKEHLKRLSLFSAKPTLIVDGGASNLNELIPNAMDKAGLMFYYTAGKQEVRSWLVRKGDNAQECASKIHTDIAKGFVKAEIIPVEDMLKCHSMQEARQKGLTKLVDRDYIIRPNTVLEIHSSL